jgi:hypothetical protein
LRELYFQGFEQILKNLFETEWQLLHLEMRKSDWGL